MYNLTLSITDDTNLSVVNELKSLPFPLRMLFNLELNELAVLCEASHAAEVERILASYA